MKLISLRLENFRGIKNATFDLDGQSSIIYGQNASGKTTVANAYSYLLTGKPYTQEPGFTPKTIGEEGPVHNLNHIVEGKFISDDGEVFVLKKDYHEIWTKRRGDLTETYTGNTVDDFVDGVPYTASSYDAFISNMFGENKEIQSLSDPEFFAEVLPWKERRSLLLDICGDISEAELVANVDGLAEALKRKEGNDYTVDKLAAVSAAQRKELNVQIQQLPARIDEASKAVLEEPKHSKKSLQTLITNNKKKMDELDLELKSLDSNSSFNAMLMNLQDEKNAIQLEAGKKRGAYDESIFAKKSEVRAAVQAAKTALETEQRKLDRLKGDLRTAQEAVEMINEGREKVTQEWQSIKAEHYEGDHVCPTCGQELPDAMRENALAQWNKSQAERLEKVLQIGKERYSKEILDNAKSTVEKLADDVEAQKVAVDQAAEELKKQDSNQPVYPEWNETEEGQAFREKLDAIHERMAIVQDSNNSEVESEAAKTEIANKIQTLKEESDAAQKEIMTFDLIESQTKRIKELEAEQKEVVSRYEEAEKNLFLCSEFVKCKASMLTERVNSRFKTVSFSMYEVQQNGGLKEQCEVMIPAAGGELIPWASANTAARINAGLEIIDALSDHYGKRIPVVIDGAESVSKYIDIQNQTIKLTVSKNHQELTIEKE